MRIGSRYFPYPVLNQNREFCGYKKSNFCVSCQKEEDDETNSIIFKNVTYDCDNEQINKLIHEGKINVYVVIECIETVFRQVFPLSENPRDIRINRNYVDGKVIVSCFASTNEPIVGFEDEDFLDDYHGIKFELDKNSIVAIDDGFDFVSNHVEKTDNYISSFITVIKNTDPKEQDTIYCELTFNKVVVKMPNDIFGKYENTKENDQMIPIYFQMLLVPTLITVFYSLILKVKEENIEDLDELQQQYKWLFSFCKAYKNNIGKELTIEELLELDPYKAAQELIKHPANNAVSGLYDLLFANIG